MLPQVAAASTGSRTWRRRRFNRSLIGRSSIGEKAVARIDWLPTNVPDVVDQGRINGIGACIVRCKQMARSLANRFLWASKQERHATNECDGTKDYPIASGLAS